MGSAPYLLASGCGTGNITAPSTRFYIFNDTMSANIVCQTSLCNTVSSMMSTLIAYIGNWQTLFPFNTSITTSTVTRGLTTNSTALNSTFLSYTIYNQTTTQSTTTAAATTTSSPLVQCYSILATNLYFPYNYTTNTNCQYTNYCTYQIQV